MIKKERCIVQVIDAILVNVPKEEIEFVALLTKISNDSYYHPPEDKYPAWYKLTNAVESKIGAIPTEDWHFAVASTLSTRSISDLRRAVAEINASKPEASR